MEIKESSDDNEKPWRNCICNDNKNIMLNILLFSSCDLFQTRNSLIEVSEAGTINTVIMENGETEINFRPS